ncbi:MAG: sigma-54 interaction domain-containing protein [Persicimonas sp.]
MKQQPNDEELITRPAIDLQDFHGMYTAAPEMRSFFEKLEKAAVGRTSVLIRGETGTGKELAARALHRLSDRSRGPFRALNCATLTGDLLASELFGHKRGAFTGATRDRAGIFEQADRGMVFLDEIAELPLDAQTRLLRVLEQQRFVPLGGQQPVSVDVQLIAATHQSLRRAVDEGRFRQDLMYRVRVIPLFLPRLIDRTGDIEALTWHFIDVFNQRKRRTLEAVSIEAMDLLESHRWPGNVRELRNVIEYAYVLGEGDTLVADQLPPELHGEPPPTQTERNQATDDEEARIRQALRDTDGNRTEAASRLDMSRTTLWRKMKEYQIE